MKKYCFEMTETKTKTTLVRIDANSKEEAGKILEELYNRNQISFKDADVETDYQYEIASDISKEDDTFDDEGVSDELIQWYDAFFLKNGY